MLPLTKDLQQKKSNLKEFIELCNRTLNYLPNVLSKVEEKGDYKIFSSNSARTIKYVHPISKKLFIQDPKAFSYSIPLFEDLVLKIKSKSKEFKEDEKN